MSLLIGLTGMLNVAGGQSYAHSFFQENMPQDFASRPIDLSYDISHHEEQDGRHTNVNLEFIESNSQSTIKFVTIVMNITETTSGKTILVPDVFHSENGTISFDITHTDGDAQIFASRENYLNAWVANRTAGMIFMNLPLKPDSTYLMHVELIGLDSVRELLPPDQVPSFDVYFDINEDIEGQAVGDQWNTAYIVGEYRYSDPPKPNQTFKMYYRVTNGEVESLTTNPIVANVTSSGNGILEIMFPRNYPYTNHENGIHNFVIDSRIDPARNIQDNRVTTDCFFVFSIPFSGSDSIELGWISLLWQEPWHGDEVAESCVPRTIVQVTPEMLQECEELGIDAGSCSEAEILKNRRTGDGALISDEERRLMEEQQNQINISMYMIGIGAAIAGVFAFFSLRKLKSSQGH